MLFRSTRVSEADIARLKSYLGLDKPLALRYVTWMFGTDWLGADWAYVGLGKLSLDRIGLDGNPIIRTDSETGETYIAQETYRFWTDPGVAHYNPGYMLWVWGEDLGIKPTSYKVETPDGSEDRAEDLQAFRVDTVRVKPPTTEDVPSDLSVRGVVVYQQGPLVTIEDLNGKKYRLEHTETTEFMFPPGEAPPRPEEGNWVRKIGRAHV